MSKRVRVGAAVVAGVVLAVAAGWLRADGATVPAASAAPVAGSDSPERRTVTGSGTGRVRGTPDTMTIGIGVETRGTSAQEALARNGERANDVLQALRKAGVAEKDVQTSRLSIAPVFDDDRSRIVGYQVSNQVTATLRDLDNAGAVIDAAADAAGDDVRVGGIRFFIEDTNALVAAARADAVERARTQAEQLAGAAGVALGEVISIEETTTPVGPPVDFDDGRAAEDSGAATPIEPGSQELAVDVIVRFAIA